MSRNQKTWADSPPAMIVRRSTSPMHAMNRYRHCKPDNTGIVCVGEDEIRETYGSPQLSGSGDAAPNERLHRLIGKKNCDISDIAEALISIDGAPFDIVSRYTNVRTGDVTAHNRRYLRMLYNVSLKYPEGSRNQLWCTGRQVEKSTTMSSKAIVLGAKFGSFKTLFISPRFDQVSVFSNQRFKPMAEDSFMVRKHLVNPGKCLWQVSQKQFTNQSFFNFRSCYATADGARGITANHLAIDEIQDIISDNIPVLEECQSHYSWETGLCYRTYAGTPKTLSNTITKRFEESAQFELLTLCTHCGHWNFPDEKIIGKNFYICTKCGLEIYPHQHAEWFPQRKAMLDTCWGFRVPQIVVPFKTHRDILKKMEDPLVPRSKFFNECLGLPFDTGEIVLPEHVMVAACSPDRRMMEPAQIRMLSGAGRIFAGIDHGSGEGENASFTVIAIGRMTVGGVFQILYIKKFVGAESNLADQPMALTRIAAAAGVSAAMSDYGFGAAQNARMVKELGWSWTIGERVLMQCLYVTQRAPAAFDASAYRYHVDRNQSMISLMDAIRRNRVEFFHVDDMKRFFPDFTSIYSEYNETTGRMKFDHTVPDDTFHAVNYAYMAALNYAGLLVGSMIPDPDVFEQPRIGPEQW